MRAQGVAGLLAQRDRPPARLALWTLHAAVAAAAGIAEPPRDPQPPSAGDRAVIKGAVKAQIVPAQRGHLDEGLVAGTDRLAEAVELAAGDPYLARLTGRFLAAATRPARLRRMSGERDRYSLSTAALRIVPSRLR